MMGIVLSSVMAMIQTLGKVGSTVVSTWTVVGQIVQETVESSQIRMGLKIAMVMTIQSLCEQA